VYSGRPLSAVTRAGTLQGEELLDPVAGQLSDRQPVRLQPALRRAPGCLEQLEVSLVVCNVPRGHKKSLRSPGRGTKASIGWRRLRLPISDVAMIGDVRQVEAVDRPPRRDVKRIVAQSYPLCRKDPDRASI
jgi:hypothetical protein